MRVIVTPIVEMTHRETNDSQDDKFEDRTLCMRIFMTSIVEKTSTQYY